MKVAADEPRCGALQPLEVIEEAEVVLHLHVAEVVPVADGGRLEALEHVDHLPFARDFLEAVPAFDSEADAIARRVLDHGAQAFEHPVEKFVLLALALFHGVNFHLHELPRIVLPVFRELHEFARVVADGHGAEVHHHVFRIHALREINRLDAVPHGAVALAVELRAELVAVGRGPRNLRRQRAEVVQRGELHFPRLVHFQNALRERQPDAVPEFDVFKTEVEDFLNHLRAVGVTARIPAG